MVPCDFTILRAYFTYHESVLIFQNVYFTLVNFFLIKGYISQHLVAVPNSQSPPHFWDGFPGKEGWRRGRQWSPSLWWPCRLTSAGSGAASRAVPAQERLLGDRWTPALGSLLVGICNTHKTYTYHHHHYYHHYHAITTIIMTTTATSLSSPQLSSSPPPAPLSRSPTSPWKSSSL